MLHRPALSLAAAGVAACLAMTGCSSGVSDTASASTEIIDAPVSDPADLKIAYFSAGTSNAYLQAAIDEAKKTAGELGADLDVFDGAFDARCSSTRCSRR